MVSQKVIEYVESHIASLSQKNVDICQLNFNTTKSFSVNLFIEHGRAWFTSDLDRTKDRAENLLDYLDKVHAHVGTVKIIHDDCYL